MYPEEDNASYSISSTTKLVLAPGDVRSQVICEVAHVTLQGALLFVGLPTCLRPFEFRPPWRFPSTPWQGTR